MSLSAPTRTNKYYISTGWKQPPGPGYNRCITYVDGYCLPNCVGYAWGRFMEIAGVTTCNLSRGNAKDWYPNTRDGYSRGQVPQVGAVMCWKTRGQYGHVAIVEQVYSDGSVLISESADCGDHVVYDPNNSRHWKTQIISTRSNYSTVYANFQGFIYNPYLSSATSTEQNEFATKIDTTQPTASSSKYIQECSNQLSQSVVTSQPVTSCAALITQSLSEKLGSVITEYSLSSANVGDIICLCNNPKAAIKSIDYLAVVTTVTKDQVQAVTSTTQLSRSQTYKKETIAILYTDPRIVYVYKPALGYKLSQLEIDPLSASLREFASLNAMNEPSINISSNLTLSLINYEAAANFVNTLSGAEPESIKQRLIDVMMSIPRTIAEYLNHFNFTLAAAIGVCANMYCDSQWNAEYIQYNIFNVPAVFGLCRWSGSRAKKLQTYSEWQTSLSAQLDFMLWEFRNTAKFSSLHKSATAETDPVVFTKMFYQQYYDSVPTDTDRREKAAKLLWSMTKEVEV